MIDEVKSAVLSEGDAQTHRNNESQEAVSPIETPNTETPSTETISTETISPDIEAEPGQDPQAPNRKGLG